MVILLGHPSAGSRRAPCVHCSEYGLPAAPTQGDVGAAEHRFTAVAIAWSRGTAAGYIAKYISKNIDGFGLDADLHGRDSKDSATR